MRLPFRLALQQHMLLARFPEWRIHAASGSWIARHPGVGLVVCDTVAELVERLARCDRYWRMP
jgi:hypothetical protein